MSSDMGSVPDPKAEGSNSRLVVITDIIRRLRRIGLPQRLRLLQEKDEIRIIQLVPVQNSSAAADS